MPQTVRTKHDPVAKPAGSFNMLAPLQAQWTWSGAWWSNYAATIPESVGCQQNNNVQGPNKLSSYGLAAVVIHCACIYAPRIGLRSFTSTLEASRAYHNTRHICLFIAGNALPVIQPNIRRPGRLSN